MSALPTGADEDTGHAVTRPFDKRRFLSAVFELLSRDGDDADHRDEAEQGLMAARLACLRNQRAASAGNATDKIEESGASLQAARPIFDRPPGAA